MLGTDQFAGLFEGSVRGIREEQPPTRIANSPSAAVIAHLVVIPYHVVLLQRQDLGCAR